MVRRINQRPKAFIGAAISVGTQLIGGILNSQKQKRAEEEQRRQIKKQEYQQQAAYMTQQTSIDNDTYADIRNQLMRVGGDSPRKGTAPAITRGGTAVPIKKNTFLLKGRKHDSGGIVIGKGKNSIEAEGEEVVQITPKQLKVFSAQPILNGNSPAELVQKGAEPSKVFNAQENFKDRNGLNDDGTKKKAMGGKEKKKSGLARTSRSQLMQRVPKYNRLYINRGDFGGGQGGGAGTGTKIHPSDDLYTISKTDTLYVPVERNFNDAFSEARRSGQATFDFQGKKYNTQLGDNPNNYAAGQSRKEETIVPIVRKRTIRTSNPNTKLKLGGLSRKDDYGFSKKPYPSVNKKDFAGGGRSYPIPTKADARDALRLAGLHGRSDVKAKVYKKYPELKKKKALLGVGTNRRLLALTQNVPSAGITAGSNIINPSATKKLSSPVPATTSVNNTSKLGNFLKSNSGELASSAIGAAGTLISGLMNKSSINKIKPPQAPQLVAPAQLKTTINVNPQLSDVRESELSQRNLIEGNTASSVANIARQQRLANSSLATRGKIRGEKENIETQLRNQDAMNRQGVAAQNAQTTNAYNAVVTQTNNEKVQALANNRTQMIEGLTAGVRDFQLGRDLRRRDDLAFAAELSKNPEQMELFMKLMQQNAGRIGRLGIRRLGGTSKLKCGGKRKVSK